MCFLSVNSQVVHRSEKHTRIRNYPCPVCGRVFRSSTLVRPHLLSAHPEVALAGPGGGESVAAKKCVTCRASVLYEESTGRRLQECKCTRGKSGVGQVPGLPGIPPPPQQGAAAPPPLPGMQQKTEML